MHLFRKEAPALLSKRKAFFVGFALTLIVLLPLYAGVFLWQVSRPADSAADTPAYRIPIALSLIHI